MSDILSKKLWWLILLLLTKQKPTWFVSFLAVVQLYRLERYSECKSVYTDLIRNSQDEYEEERKTNLAAVVAAMSQWENSPLVSAPQIFCLCVVCLYPFLCCMFVSLNQCCSFRWCSHNAKWHLTGFSFGFV